jgi:probable RNA-binding protein EIF1AD
MGKAKSTQRLFDSLGNPPDEIKPFEVIGSVIKPRGNSLYDISIPSSEWVKVESISKSNIDQDLGSENKSILASMPPKFRNTIFVKRGGFVVVELYQLDDDQKKTLAIGKVKGDISNIVTNKKDWQRYPYWPNEFKGAEQYDFDISDEDDEDELETDPLEDES